VPVKCLVPLRIDRVELLGKLGVARMARYRKGLASSFSWLKIGKAKLIANPTRVTTERAFMFSLGGGFRIVCRGWPTSEFSHVASNVRVAGGKENTFGQRSLSDMQIARFVLSKVNEKMRRAAHSRRLPNAHVACPRGVRSDIEESRTR
jgi:hypothetical protein